MVGSILVWLVIEFLAYVSTMCGFRFVDRSVLWILQMGVWWDMSCKP